MKSLQEDYLRIMANNQDKIDYVKKAVFDISEYEFLNNIENYLKI